MKKVITILGARPQFIKASAVSRAFNQQNEIEEKILHTGQHFDEKMSQVFFDEMNIPKPTYHLDINSLSHGAMTGRMLEGIEQILLKEKPDWVLIYGDTNSTIAGALAAKKLGIKVAHVEAGLRSFDMKMPEEINRILTDQISDALYCPTDLAVQNLEAEGFSSKTVDVLNVGDVMYDCALFYSQMAKKPKGLQIDSPFILTTIHRQENVDNKDKLKWIIDSLNELHNEIPVVCPLHPRTAKAIERIGIETHFIVLPPTSYLEMIYLLNECQLVVTDSGGLQKEAYYFKKFGITLRDTTEWRELVDNNYNVLVNVGEENLINTVRSKLNQKIENPLELYGDGNSAEKIVEHLANFEKAAVSQNYSITNIQ